MHSGITVQLIDDCDQLFFADRGVKLVFERSHTDFNRLLALGAHIDLAGRIFTHQYHRKTRHNAMVLLQAGHMFAHLPAHLRREGLAINQLCSHPSSPKPKISAFKSQTQRRIPATKGAGMCLEQAFDFARIIEHDCFSSWLARQSRHRHDFAADRYNKTRASGKAHFTNRH